MTVGVMESGGALERGKRRPLIAAPSKETTATFPKSRRVMKTEALFGKADEYSGIESGLGEMKGGGIKIVPFEGPLEGGTPFLLSFESFVSEEVTSVFATFGNHGKCQLEKIGPVRFVGESAPAAATPGTVPVVVTTLEGNLLGATTYRYTDRREESEEEVLSRLLVDRELQRKFFERKKGMERGSLYSKWASVSSGVKSKESRVKDGTPTDDDLEKVAHHIGEQWKTLGRHLGVGERMLQETDRFYETMLVKGYEMLRLWKQREGSAATYQVLHDALAHPLVNRQDLAEKFCVN